MTLGVTLPGPLPADETAPRGAETPTRVRLYHLLAESVGVTQAAKKIMISRACADRHASRLEEAGALRRVPGLKSPRLFEKGPKAAAWERANVTLSPENRGGRSLSPIGQAWRAHHWSWVWSYTAGPSTEPAWSSESEHSSVRHFHAAMPVGSEIWKLRDIRGKVKRSLMVRPAAQYVFPESLIATEMEKGREVHAFFLALARRHGYLLVGSMRRAHPTEYALPMPGLVPVGRPGVDPVHVDESEGEGRSELETRSATVVGAVARLPESQAEFERRILALEEGMRAAFARDGRLLTVTEGAVERLRRIEGET